MSGVVRIGTSGWYYQHWLGVFYPAKLAPKELFHFYSLQFDTVEQQHVLPLAEAGNV